MKFGGICIETSNAPRLAAFYGTFLQEAPVIEGSHYGFAAIAVYDPGNVKAAQEKNIWLSFYDKDIDTLYERLKREIPDMVVLVPPERKPWGAYAFWCQDPDGNKIAVYQA